MPEIEVTDPRHPLFGRRFPLHSRSAPSSGAGHVFVGYRRTMILRLPVDATSLALPRPAPQTKLTFEAVTELVTLAGHCEGLCPPDPPMSGPTSPGPCAPGSATTSPRSSRR